MIGRAWDWGKVGCHSDVVDLKTGLTGVPQFPDFYLS